MNNSLRILTISNGIQVFAATLIIPIFALFIEDIGGGPEVAGILFGVSFVSMAIGNIFMIRIKDKGHLDARLYRLGLLVKMTAWILLAIHQSIASLFIAQIIIGIATAIGAPAFDSLMSENLDKNKHIREWSQWNLIQNIATASASVLSGFVVVAFGFGALFVVMAAITALAFTVSSNLVRQLAGR